MDKNLALGLEIGIPILAIGIGYWAYSYSQNKQSQALENSVVGSYNAANNITQQPDIQPSNYGYNYGDEGVVQGGRKKSKRRKGRKNASKKKR
jgi:hypothetical protein